MTIIGSQIANERAVETTDETRSPLNVELVIDDSGSMNHFEDWGFTHPDGSSTYNYDGGAYETVSWSDWTNWEDVPQASYADPQDDQSPSNGYQWVVRKPTTNCDGNGDGDGNNCDPDYDYYLVNDDEDIHLEQSDDIVRRQKTGTSVTVPEGVVYIGDPNDDNYIDTDEVYYPGETLSESDWSHYHVLDLDGNDPYYERLNASKTFVSALNDSKDEVGVVRFDGDSYDEQSLTSDFDAVNDTLTRETFTSDGATNLYTSMQDAINNLESADESRDGLDTQDTIVLLTDGKHSDDAPGTESDIKDLAETAHDKGIRIYR